VKQELSPVTLVIHPPSPLVVAAAGGLPHGWEEAYTAQGRKYYIDHNTQSTSWLPPPPASPRQKVPGGPPSPRKRKRPRKPKPAPPPRPATTTTASYGPAVAHGTPQTFLLQLENVLLWFGYIAKRHQVFQSWLRREPQPWTDDPVIRAGRELALPRPGHGMRSVLSRTVPCLQPRA